MKPRVAPSGAHGILSKILTSPGDLAARSESHRARCKFHFAELKRGSGLGLAGPPSSARDSAPGRRGCAEERRDGPPGRGGHVERADRLSYGEGKLYEMQQTPPYGISFCGGRQFAALILAREIKDPALDIVRIGETLAE